MVRDVIIVSSVSCIYNLGSLEDYKSQLPVVYQFLGEIKMLQGKEKEAIDFYEKAKTLLLLKSEP